MSEQEGYQYLPRVPFSLPELAAIMNVIWSYVLYLESLPLSPKRERRMETLKSIKERLQTQLYTLKSEASLQLALTPDEVAELLAAMVGFVEQIQRLFPKNDERDKMVSTVNYWRLRLIAILTEHIVE
ncbi:MAG TPA: hypothetical protein VEL31_30075 [Ktedonobacteraceae bacterium]|nr:hypothetical protein [Ktedonobacteraceae bacterium]